MISAAVREWISVWFFVLAMSVLLFFVAVIMPFMAIAKMVMNCQIGGHGACEWSVWCTD